MRIYSGSRVGCKFMDIAGDTPAATEDLKER